MALHSLYVSQESEERRRALNILLASVNNAFQKFLTEEADLILSDETVPLVQGVVDLEYDQVYELSEKLKTYRQIFSDLKYFSSTLEFHPSQDNFVRRIDMVIPEKTPQGNVSVDNDDNNLRKVFGGE